MGRHLHTRRSNAAQLKKKPPKKLAFDLKDPALWLQENYKDHGVAIGYLKNGEVSYYVHGFANPTATDKKKVRADTKFEIGSITKPMVGLLLSKMSEENSLKLDTFISDVFPDISSPAKNITMLELATHRSGLPRLPQNQSLANIDNPYQGYNADMLKEALQNTLELGEEFAYSNFGYGVLGTAIEVMGKESLGQQMKDYIFAPANMNNTVLSTDDANLIDVADGHNVVFEKVGHWTFDAIAGAGAVVSTAEDMLAFGSYILKYVEEPHVKAFLSEQTDEVPSFGVGIMLRESVAFHGGQTGGFASFFAIDLKTNTAVVVLTNVGKDAGALGFNVLRQLNDK